MRLEIDGYWRTPEQDFFSVYENNGGVDVARVNHSRLAQPSAQQPRKNKKIGRRQHRKAADERNFQFSEKRLVSRRFAQAKQRRQRHHPKDRLDAVKRIYVLIGAVEVKRTNQCDIKTCFGKGLAHKHLLNGAGRIILKSFLLKIK